MVDCIKCFFQVEQNSKVHFFSVNGGVPGLSGDNTINWVYQQIIGFPAIWLVQIKWAYINDKVGFSTIDDFAKYGAEKLFTNMHCVR